MPELQATQETQEVRETPKTHVIAYLDTSTLRKYSKNLAKDSDKKELWTSSLAVFELMSGISDEEDFIRRKVAVKRLLESDVYIDWDSYRCKMYKSFHLPYDDIEGIVVKRFAYAMTQSETFEDFKKVRIFTAQNDYYDFESLQELDDRVVFIGNFTSQISQTEEWKKLTKDERKEARKEILESFPSYAYLLSEFAVIPIAENFAGDKQLSKAYSDMIEKYNFALQLYLHYVLATFLLAEINSSNTQKNDLFDMLHLLYLRHGDIMIAEDNIFKRINSYLERIKVITLPEFMNDDTLGYAMESHPSFVSGDDVENDGSDHVGHEIEKSVDGNVAEQANNVGAHS